MNKPTRNKHPIFKIANDAPVDLPTPSTNRGWWNFGSLLGTCLVVLSYHCSVTKAPATCAFEQCTYHTHPLYLVAAVTCVPSANPPTHLPWISPASGAANLSPELYVFGKKGFLSQPEDQVHGLRYFGVISTPYRQVLWWHFGMTHIYFWFHTSQTVINHFQAISKNC